MAWISCFVRGGSRGAGNTHRITYGTSYDADLQRYCWWVDAHPLPGHATEFGSIRDDGWVVLTGGDLAAGGVSSHRRRDARREILFWLDTIE